MILLGVNCGFGNSDCCSLPLSVLDLKNGDAQLLDALGFSGNKNFYASQHTFETIGGEAKDQIAVDRVMGHARDDMVSFYRERLSDARLKAVSEFVRRMVVAGGRKEGERSASTGEPEGRRVMQKDGAARVVSLLRRVCARPRSHCANAFKLSADLYFVKKVRDAGVNHAYDRQL